jgi:hypothetical protein
VNHAQQNCPAPIPNILPMKEVGSKIPNQQNKFAAYIGARARKKMA